MTAEGGKHMDNDIKTSVMEQEKTEEIPTLTLDDEEPKMNFVMNDHDDPINKVAEVPEQHFSEAEQMQIDQFAKQIDLRNMDQIMKYGSTAQKKSSSFSEAALKGVKTKDFGVQKGTQQSRGDESTLFRQRDEHQQDRQSAGGTSVHSAQGYIPYGKAI